MRFHHFNAEHGFKISVEWNCCLHLDHIDTNFIFRRDSTGRHSGVRLDHLNTGSNLLNPAWWNGSLCIDHFDTGHGFKGVPGRDGSGGLHDINARPDLLHNFRRDGCGFLCHKHAGSRHTFSISWNGGCHIDNFHTRSVHRGGFGRDGCSQFANKHPQSGLYHTAFWYIGSGFDHIDT